MYSSASRVFASSVTNSRTVIGAASIISTGMAPPIKATMPPAPTTATTAIIISTRFMPLLPYSRAFNVSTRSSELILPRTAKFAMAMNIEVNTAAIKKVLGAIYTGNRNNSLS